MGKKLELAIDCIRSLSTAASSVMPVASQMMRFPFVGQLSVKNVLQAPNQFGIADRKEDFDAMTQVAPHEVGAAEINFLGPSVPEIVDAAMLQKPAYDAGDADIITESLQPKAASNKVPVSAVLPSHPPAR